MCHAMALACNQLPTYIRYLMSKIWGKKSCRAGGEGRAALSYWEHSALVAGCFAPARVHAVSLRQNWVHTAVLSSWKDSASSMSNTTQSVTK